jgi:hypothetical protein
MTTAPRLFCGVGYQAVAALVPRRFVSAGPLAYTLNLQRRLRPGTVTEVMSIMAESPFSDTST